MKLLILLLLLGGCDPMLENYKCIDGETYIKLGGAWVIQKSLGKCHSAKKNNGGRE